MTSPSSHHDGSEAVIIALRHVHSLSIKALDGVKIPVGGDFQEGARHSKSLSRRVRKESYCCRLGSSFINSVWDETCKRMAKSVNKAISLRDVK
jgi:tryptophanyl-tRNA synthetase